MTEDGLKKIESKRQAFARSASSKQAPPRKRSKSELQSDVKASNSESEESTDSTEDGIPFLWKL